MATDRSGSEDKLPIPGIDRMFHQPARFIVTSLLYSVSVADFLFLLRQTNLTPGNLSSHLTKLKAAGYVVIHKDFVDNKPHTAVRLTGKGRTAFEKYRNNMREFSYELADQRQEDSARMRAVKCASGSPSLFGSDDEPGQSVNSAYDRIVNILGRSPIFSHLSKQQLEELSKSAKFQHIEAGQFLFLESEVLDYFCIVAEGRFKILKHSTSGRDFIVTFNGPGDLLGNIPLVSGRSHPTSAQAITRGELAVIRCTDIWLFISRHPELSSEIYKRMLNAAGTRSALALGRLGDLLAESASNRLASTLYSLSSRFGTTVPFCREELAQMSGTCTETAIRFLSRLKEANIVRPARGKVIVLDPTSLRLLADGQLDIPAKRQAEPASTDTNET